MKEVFALAFSFPSVAYTVLLGVVLVYWLFVVVGAINLGDGSADGALDGFDPEGAIGAGKGALEGAAKGALQGHLDGMADGAADVGDVGDGGDAGDAGDGGDDANEGSVLAALVSALHLRSVPATVILSLVVTFSWLVCTVAMQIMSRNLPHGGGALAWLVLLGAPLLALPLTSIVARPLAKVFKHAPATSRSDLIGKTCVVRTGTVTSTFGEAVLEDGGAGLVLRVRVDRELPVKRGDQMMIVEWDREHESFLVEPLDAVESLASDTHSKKRV